MLNAFISNEVICFLTFSYFPSVPLCHTYCNNHFLSSFITPLSLYLNIFLHFCHGVFSVITSMCLFFLFCHLCSSAPPPGLHTFIKGTFVVRFDKHLTLDNAQYVWFMNLLCLENHVSGKRLSFHIGREILVLVYRVQEKGKWLHGANERCWLPLGREIELCFSLHVVTIKISSVRCIIYNLIQSGLFEHSGDVF